jgi:hypothetical protein
MTIVNETQAPGSPSAEMMPGSSQTDLIPGSVAAALVASSVGAVALGVGIVVAEASPAAKTWLALGTTAGPLTGKSIAATLVFLLVWAGLQGVLGRRRVSTQATVRWTGALLVAGLVLSFPPVFQLFTVAH